MLVRGLSLGRLAEGDMAELGPCGDCGNHPDRSPESACFHKHAESLTLQNSVWLNYVNMRVQNADT